MLAEILLTVHQKSFCTLYHNAEKVVEELMEDMDTYTDPDESDSSADDVDPTWEPEKLDQEYERTADDDDNFTRRILGQS